MEVKIEIHRGPELVHTAGTSGKGKYNVDCEKKIIIYRESQKGKQNLTCGGVVGMVV
jgi:hypothetical protein